LIVAGLLVFCNSMSGRSIHRAAAAVPVFYSLIRLTMTSYNDFGAWGFLYFSMFEVPNESLLESSEPFLQNFLTPRGQI
jgi:hypothetical protein